MQKSTGIIWTVIISVFAIIFIGGELNSEEPAWWNPVDYAHITDLDYKAIVVDEPGSDGKLTVTQRVTYDVHAFSRDNLFWELWRDMPELLVDDVDVEYTIKSVKEITDSGSSIIYDESYHLYWWDSDYTLYPNKWFYSPGPYNESAQDYESLLIYIDGIYREKMTFEIEYEVTNMSLRYLDCSELYISFYSEETINFLESFKAEILVPIDKMPKPGNYSAYTYGTKQNDFPYTESDSVNPGYYTFQMELDKTQLKFRPYNQYLEFSLISYGEDKHAFTQYAAENTYYNDDALAEIRAEQATYDETPQKFFVYKISAFIILLAISLFILFYTFRTDERMRKEYIFYKPKKNVSFDFAKDPITIEPAIAVALLNAKEKKDIDTEKVYIGTMMSLVNKGYINFEQIYPPAGWDTQNININILPDSQDSEPLTRIERLYFDLIKRHAHGLSSIPLSTFYNYIANDYEHTNSILKQINTEMLNKGVMDGYFQKIDYKEPAKKIRKKATSFLVFGILFTIFANLLSYFTRLDFAFGGYFILGLTTIFSGIYMKKISPKFTLLTELGENEYAKLESFYQFLSNDASIKNSDIKNVKEAENILVYATAFGITGLIFKRLANKFPEISNSPIVQTPYRSNYYRVRYGNRHRSRRLFLGNNTFGSSIKRASTSGRAGGGGYGGAGRGGGGGGGGH